MQTQLSQWLILKCQYYNACKYDKVSSRYGTV